MAQDSINDSTEINGENAILLLAAAQELGLPADVVATTSEGFFRVPQNVVDKAGLGEKKAKAPKADTPPKVQKKAPAKRAAKKAAPAKKAAAPKAAATEKE